MGLPKDLTKLTKLTSNFLRLRRIESLLHIDRVLSSAVLGMLFTQIKKNHFYCSANFVVALLELLGLSGLRPPFFAPQSSNTTLLGDFFDGSLDFSFCP